MLDSIYHVAIKYSKSHFWCESVKILRIVSAGKWILPSFMNRYIERH